MDTILIGYSGHSLVVLETALLVGKRFTGYCDKRQNSENPFDLSYLGDEISFLSKNPDHQFFVSIGANSLRQSIGTSLLKLASPEIALIHPTAYVSKMSSVGSLTLICAGAIVQPAAQIGIGVIVNTGARIDHECIIHDYAHIGPGATLTGNIEVGKAAFIGAGAVILPGRKVGENATLGAGSVLTKDLPSNAIWAGNPARPINNTKT